MSDNSLFALLADLGPYRGWILFVLVAIPVAIAILGVTLGHSNPRAFDRLMSIPAYISVLPGLLMAWIITYTMLFTQQNVFAELDFLLVFGPVLSMIACILLITRFTSFERVPGADKLGAMILLATVAFFALMLLSRLYIFVGFFGSFFHLALVFGGLYFLIHMAWGRLVR